MMNITRKDLDTYLGYAIRGLLFAMVAIVPFIVGSNTLYFPFVSGKGFAFRIIIELVFALWIIQSLVRSELALRKTPVFILFGVLILWLLVADSFSPNPYKSFWSNYERMEGFVTLLHVFILYIVARNEFNHRDWFRLWNISLATSLVTVAYGFLQLAGKITIHQGGVRVDGPFGNAAYFALYLLVHVFIALLYAGRHKLLRWGYVAIAVLDGIMMYNTATRGSLLGLLGGLFFMGIILAAYRLKDRGSLRLPIGLAIAVLLVIGGFWSVKDTSFVRHSSVLSRFGAISLHEPTTESRFIIWGMAIKGSLERPLFGWGQESFNYVFNKFYDPRLHDQEQWFDRAHNVLLDWLVTSGFVGLLLYIGIFVGLLYSLYKNEWKAYDKAALVGLLAAYTIHNLFVFDTVISYMLFALFVAYIDGSYGFEEPVFVESEKSLTVDISAATITILALLMVVYTVNIKPLRADRALIDGLIKASALSQAKDTTTFNNTAREALNAFKKAIDLNTFGTTEVRENLLQFTLNINSSQTIDQTTLNTINAYVADQIELQAKETPEDARYQIYAGGFFRQIGDYDKALTYALKAHELSPQKQTIDFEVGNAYILKGQYDDAYKMFEEAYTLAPEYTEAKVALIVGALYDNKANEALKLMAEINRHTVIHDGRIIQALAQTKQYAPLQQLWQDRIAENQADGQAHLSLAAVYYGLGQKQKAIAEIREVITLNPQFKEQGEYYIGEIEAGHQL